MQYLRFDISYDGSRFLGSATQPHQNTIQDNLHLALSRIGIFDKPLFASRTDKGVHALQNVCKIQSTHHFTDFFWMKNKLNNILGGGIKINKITIANKDFNPRFDAIAREYRYIFSHDDFSPFLSNYYTFYESLDVVKLNNLVRSFIGKYDFSGFCLINQSKNNIRTIYNAHAFSYKNFTIVVFRANGFLRGQIRYMVGFLLYALKNNLGEKELFLQLEQKKHFAHTLALPNGLYLSKILY